ncbi:MAG: hypothetical protein ACTSWC_02450 [Promethearchaeota archaeon]
MTLIKFYVSQGIRSSKKNAIIILILALSLALIPALSMLVNGFFKTLLTQMSSFDDNPTGYIEVNKPTFNENLDFQGEKTYIERVLSENELQYDSLEPHLEISIDEAFFYSNFSFPSNNIIENPLYKNIPANYARLYPKFEFHDDSYYQMNFFNKSNYTPSNAYYSYVIVDGNAPKQMNDILIDYRFAQKCNLSIGTLFNLTLRLNHHMWNIEYDEEYINSTSDDFNFYYEKSYYTDIQITVFNISGFYLRSYGGYDREWDYTYEDYIENEPYDISNLDFYDYLFFDEIFVKYNFSLPREQNFSPVFQLLTQIDNLTITSNRFSPYFYDFKNCLYFDTYFEFNSNFDEVNLNSLFKLAREIQYINEKVTLDLGENYYFSWDMVYIIPEFTMILYAARVVIAIINLPILFFVVSLGILSARIIRKTRIPDYLRMRIKGLDRKMIIRLSSIEALVNSVFSCILSFLFGLILFFALRNEALKIFESLILESMPFPASYIKPIVLNIDVINILFWAIVCSFIMYIPIFYYNRKLKLSDLIQIKEAKDLPVVYDESTIYDKNVDQVKLNWEEFLQLNTSETKSAIEEQEEENKINLTQKEMANNQKKPKKIKKARRKRKSVIYENVIKEFEKKIPKIAIIIIIIGLIPIAANYLIFYFIDNSPPDFLVDLLDYLVRYQTIFILSSVLSPILILSGIFRFIGIEKPSRFAKISKWLSTPILGPLNRLFGLKMISSKELIKWIRVFTVFATILITINMMTQSVYRYQVVSENLLIGGDVKLEADVNLIDSEISTDFINQTEVRLKNLVNEKNISYVNQVVTCQQNQGKFIHAYGSFFDDFKVFSTNLSLYCNIINEDNKILPNKNITRQIEKLIEYEQARNESNLPGILISKQLQYQIENNILQFNLTYINNSNQALISKNFKFKVLGYLEFPPGLFPSSYDRYWYLGGNFALVDQSNLYSQTSTLQIRKIYQFIDLNLESCPNSTTIRKNITDSTEEIIYYNSISFYNQDFSVGTENPELFSLFSIFQIIEIIMYFLGFILAITLGLLLNAIKNSDERFYSLLYTRGYGKKGTIKILLSQIFVMYTLSSILGFICGYILPSFLVYQIQDQFSYMMGYFNKVTFSLPIYWEPLKILLLLASILISAVVLLFLINFFKKNNVNKSLQQF